MHVQLAMQLYFTDLTVLDDSKVIKSMKSDEVLELVDTLRLVGGESEKVEAKTAADGFPDSLRATLSAFANTDGGTVLLGVDERQGFAPDRLNMVGSPLRTWFRSRSDALDGISGPPHNRQRASKSSTF